MKGKLASHIPKTSLTYHLALSSQNWSWPIFSKLVKTTKCFAASFPSTHYAKCLKHLHMVDLHVSIKFYYTVVLLGGGEGVLLFYCFCVVKLPIAVILKISHFIAHLSPFLGSYTHWETCIYFKLYRSTTKKKKGGGG